jgi:Flp pilus assembly protein TadG
MALILPLLILIVLGCVDFGRFATSYTAVTNAAREGANFGGTHPFTSTTQSLWKQKIIDAVTDEMAGIPGFSADKLSVSEPAVIDSKNSSRVRVEVTYTFQPAIRWPALPRKLDISRAAEMPVIR